MALRGLGEEAAGGGDRLLPEREVSAWDDADRAALVLQASVRDEGDLLLLWRPLHRQNHVTSTHRSQDQEIAHFTVSYVIAKVLRHFTSSMGSYLPLTTGNVLTTHPASQTWRQHPSRHRLQLLYIRYVHLHALR